MGAPFDGGQPKNARIALEGVNSPEQGREMRVCWTGAFFKFSRDCSARSSDCPPSSAYNAQISSNSPDNSGLLFDVPLGA